MLSLDKSSCGLEMPLLNRIKKSLEGLSFEVTLRQNHLGTGRVEGQSPDRGPASAASRLSHSHGAWGHTKSLTHGLDNETGWNSAYYELNRNPIPENQQRGDRP